MTKTANLVDLYFGPVLTREFYEANTTKNPEVRRLADGSLVDGLGRPAIEGITYEQYESIARRALERMVGNMLADSKAA